MNAKLSENPPAPDTERILDVAASRGKSLGLPYAGAVTPAEAHILATQHGAKIIDVRSRFEYEYIGRVPGSPLIEWKQWPGGEINPRFLDELQARAAKDDIVMFLCRSGVRSHTTAALAAQNGYTHAYNILEGFEGDLDATGQRGTLGGWRKAGLPWVQS